MDDDALFGIDILVLVGNNVGMMTAGREDGSHERFLHLRHLRGIVLQEGLVPDGPHAVEILVTAETLVVVIVLTSVIFLETRGTREGLESHRTALGSVEEGRLVAFARKQGSNATHLIHRGRRQEERFHKHRDTAQYRGHAVDALAPVAIRMGERDALGNERIHARGVAFIPAVFQGLVERPDILAPEALHNEHHHVLPSKTRITRISRNTRIMDWGIDALHLVLILIIFGHGEDGLADGPIEREGGVEHQSRLNGTIHILVGIRDGDGTDGCGEAAADAGHYKRCQCRQ